jgi:hypothetical protein
VNGTSSYTASADNVSDLIMSASYPMTNVAYVNGALAALATTAIPKFLVGWNNALWGGFWNIGGTDYPTSVYFSASVDNSGLSNGNNTSWNSYNYINVGTLDDGKIIGLYPGLQGRLYVFKEFGTYIIQPTGNSALPYWSGHWKGQGWDLSIQRVFFQTFSSSNLQDNESIDPTGRRLRRLRYREDEVLLGGVRYEPNEFLSDSSELWSRANGCFLNHQLFPKYGYYFRCEFSNMGNTRE